MKIRFKHQKFQEDAALAVCDVFAGQPHLTPTYLMDRGIDQSQDPLMEQITYDDFTGWNNQPIIPALTDDRILENLQAVQQKNRIEKSTRLEGKYNLTVEMETGVGKTYTYIKTMYELNRRYGWSKFIVVVPSVAIREGVYKSFQMTEEHFAEEYGKKIRYFIYNSKQLHQIDQFASDSSINVMIINSQAFNARGKDARRIYMELDEFRSRRPIDIIAKTNPILIIDEPQSVEGKKTVEGLKEFNPLFTLRYSATHKESRIFNMVYRLDAMEAYNKRLVKKIAVKGITETGSAASDAFVYVEKINLSKKAPTATLRFDRKGVSSITRTSRVATDGFNLYDHSGNLEAYKEGFVVTEINGWDQSVSFMNGLKVHAGEVSGHATEDELRRIQIRETILSHIEKERELFTRGIKVLSLFFIDEVAKYKQYDEVGDPINGIYADQFEREYYSIVEEEKQKAKDVRRSDPYIDYLAQFQAETTHAGYFSIDKKGKMIDSVLKRNEESSSDVDAYDLIMKNKELLLDRDPQRSPVRFIFSHSALREGWDNPNVFQICTLKESGSTVRRRQEVGRGLRLSVNEVGERMDTNILGNEVHEVNVLTVIASESYDQFTRALQGELADVLRDRPRVVDFKLFENKQIADEKGVVTMIDGDMARSIHYDLIQSGYVDRNGNLTDHYHEDKNNGVVILSEDLAPYSASIVELLDTVFDENALRPEDVRKLDTKVSVDESKLKKQEFLSLWDRINQKSVYTVNFDSDELIQKCIEAMDDHLKVKKIYFKVKGGQMERIESKEQLQSGSAFVHSNIEEYDTFVPSTTTLTYDLVGKLVEKTQLTRKDIIKILKGIRQNTFDQFKNNPEDFILKATRLINDEKATAIIQHITYDILDEKYDTTVFTEAQARGRLNVNAMKTKKQLFDHLIYDSTNEKKFAENLESSEKVSVYVKLPSGFTISTPIGDYNPDWAIAFKEGSVKHVYFVAETKGTLRSMELHGVENSKIYCAKEHFKAISNSEVVYDVVDSYDRLMDLVME